MRRRSLTLIGGLAIFAVLLTALLLPVPALAQTSPVSVVEYYHTDALGSVRVVTDQNAQVVSRHDFLAFGEELTPLPNAKEKKLFTGHERDTETGLDYLGARFYRPQVGRFTTPDPIGLLGGSNMYAYVGNNPSTYVDPNGLQAQLPPGTTGSKENPLQFTVNVVASMPPSFRPPSWSPWLTAPGRVGPNRSPRWTATQRSASATQQHGTLLRQEFPWTLFFSINGALVTPAGGPQGQFGLYLTGTSWPTSMGFFYGGGQGWGLNLGVNPSAGLIFGDQSVLAGPMWDLTGGIAVGGSILGNGTGPVGAAYNAPGLILKPLPYGSVGVSNTTVQPLWIRR